jgi:hypothetical protein
VDNSKTILRNSNIDTSILIGCNIKAFKMLLYTGLIIGTFAHTAITVFVLDPNTISQIESIQNIINVFHQDVMS